MSATNKIVLVAALNWGLGHASRTIPMIHYLIKNCAEVILASDGDALLLLQKEFPNLKAIELPGYNISYKTNNMAANILPQIPKILKTIQKERKIIAASIKKHKINVLISDNRYGVYHQSVPSVIICHQINLQGTNWWTSRILNMMHYRFLNKFNEIWVPDASGKKSISGLLSSNEKLKNVRYLGVISRMQRKELEQKHKLVVVLSGPEPQRSYLEEKILHQLEGIKGKVVLVRGTTKGKELQKAPNNISIRDLETTQSLNQLMIEAETILCRSGYSSLMDIAYLQHNSAILVPTPGQTEQEYLAKNLKDKKYFYSQSQKEFDLKIALQEVKKYKGFEHQYNLEEMKKQIREWLQNI